MTRPHNHQLPDKGHMPPLHPLSLLPPACPDVPLRGPDLPGAVAHSPLQARRSQTLLAWADDPSVKDGDFLFTEPHMQQIPEQKGTGHPIPTNWGCLREHDYRVQQPAQVLLPPGRSHSCHHPGLAQSLLFLTRHTHSEPNSLYNQTWLHSAPRLPLALSFSGCPESPELDWVPCKCFLSVPQGTELQMNSAWQ